MVVINQVDARGSVLALSRAVVQVFRTGSATPAFQACALEATRFIVAGLRIDAGPERGRGVRVALVHVWEGDGARERGGEGKRDI